MSKFKVGDSIRIYGFDPERAEITITRKVAIIHSKGDDAGMIETDAGEFVHPKQCRKLVSKPKREFWIIQDRLNRTWTFNKYSEALEYISDHDNLRGLKPFMVREVVKK